MNKYTEQIIANLESQLTDVERNYDSFLAEWENQQSIRKAYEDGGKAIDREYIEAGLSASACFRKLEELHEESCALFEAIRAIKNA